MNSFAASEDILGDRVHREPPAPPSLNQIKRPRRGLKTRKAMKQNGAAKYKKKNNKYISLFSL